MCRHSVHFYQGAYPAQEASDFIAAGVLAGDTCVVLLAQPHREAVASRLRIRGIEIDAADGSQSGACRVIDTEEVLAQLCVGGRLDVARAAESIDPLLTPAIRGGSNARVRLVGDPAALLFAAGNSEDAVALEALVDGLAEAHGASVYCAYPIEAFCREGSANSLLRISAEHDALQFPKALWVDGFRQAAQSRSLSM